MATWTPIKLYQIYWCYKTWRDYSNWQNQQDLLARAQALGVDSHSLAALNGKDLNDGSSSSNEDGNKTVPSELEPEGFFTALSPQHLASFKNASPFLRSVCLFIPYVSNYLFATILMGIAKKHPDKNSTVSKHPIFWAITLTILSYALSMLSMLDGAWFLLHILSVIPMVIAQTWVNRFWDEQERGKNLIVRQAFSFKETIAIIAGALYLGFVVASFILKVGK